MRYLLSSQVVSASLQNQKSSRFTAVKYFYQFYVFYCTDGKLHFRTNIILIPRYYFPRRLVLLMYQTQYFSLERVLTPILHPFFLNFSLNGNEALICTLLLAAWI